MVIWCIFRRSTLFLGRLYVFHISYFSDIACTPCHELEVASLARPCISPRHLPAPASAFSKTNPSPSSPSSPFSSSSPSLTSSLSSPSSLTSSSSVFSPSFVMIMRSMVWMVYWNQATCIVWIGEEPNQINHLSDALETTKWIHSKLVSDIICVTLFVKVFQVLVITVMWCKPSSVSIQSRHRTILCRLIASLVWQAQPQVAAHWQLYNRASHMQLFWISMLFQAVNTVKLNFKAGLFSSTFLFEHSFLAKSHL